MQPTDQESGRFSCSLDHEGREGGIERGTRVRQGLVVEVTAMKARVTRILIALSSVAMIALAGGASLRGL